MTTFLSRKYTQISKLIQKGALFSTVNEISVESHKPRIAYRCPHSNPADHGLEDLGLFYTIPEDEGKKKIFALDGLMRKFRTQCETFNEMGIMIRKPGLEIIHCLKNTDFNNPINKYLLYGRPGAGKSTTLCHVLHYAYKENFLLVHVPWVRTWTKYSGHSRTLQNSEFRPGFVDQPLMAVEWLQHFRVQNEHILQNPELTVAKEFHWNVRESTKPGDTLLQLIDFGIARGRYASEIVVLLLEEIKRLSKEGKLKTFVAIDGFNAFFQSYSKMRTEEHVRVPPEKITLLHGFMNLTKTDWHNGAAVLIADSIAWVKMGSPHGSELPIAQLTMRGFEYLDPFIPIEVKYLSDREMTSMLAYYRDRLWLNHDERVDDELKFLCGGSGYDLMNICRSL